MRSLLAAVLATLMAINGSLGADTPRVSGFSPQGSVKQVRQVHVAFSEPMVAFGDPHGAGDPFAAECAEPGKGRWIDPRTWVYDFDRQLPGGVACSFRLKPGLRTLSGRELGGTRDYRFSTGGPAVLSSLPFEGQRSIGEDQVFILTLDATPDEASVLSNAGFAVAGIKDRIGLRILRGEEREQLLATQPWLREREPDPSRHLLVQAVERLPVKARVGLVWGRGIRSLSGVAVERDRLRVVQSVIPAVPARVVQAVIDRLAPEAAVPIERPAGALSAGAVQVALRPRLAGSLDGVADYMRGYPHACLEQKVSIAVALQDAARQDRLTAELPAYVDADGLLKYFPSSASGDPVLTAYVLSVTHEAGWRLPDNVLGPAAAGLRRFVEGSLQRTPPLPTADLTLRKLAALAARAAAGRLHRAGALRRAPLGARRAPPARGRAGRRLAARTRAARADRIRPGRGRRPGSVSRAGPRGDASARGPSALTACGRFGM